MTMFLERLLALMTVLAMVLGVPLAWYLVFDFNALDRQWWVWLKDYVLYYKAFPPELLKSSLIVTSSSLALLIGQRFFFQRPGTRTLIGGRQVSETHGSARWAKWREIKRMDILGGRGVVIGGYRHRGQVRQLTHDGPEHVMAFAPTRSGKGVCLVIPTLLNWKESVLVLDIKGENYALTANYRKSLGHRVIKFDPAALKGSARYNPLEEIRLGSDYEIADCQNVASIIIDPNSKGLKDYWMQAGWEWLAAFILHVCHRIRIEEKRTASLRDVLFSMSVGARDEGQEEKLDHFDQLCQDMARFDHRSAQVNEAVKLAAADMQKKASGERSGVHSSAKVQLALYADPIVARNTARCDFRIKDLMNAERPAALYIVIPPSDIDRLRPLVRVILNQFLTRLTREMSFHQGQAEKSYKHRLLLLLDEFTAIGKLEIFERSLAFMAGYGLKVFIIVQDLMQLQKAYGREESILSNCHIRIATAPNKIETAELLSKMSGKTTLIQKKRSSSSSDGRPSGRSESQSEISRPLLTADECMALKGLDRQGAKVIPGDMLIFIAGKRPIYGRQRLFFQDERLLKRTQTPRKESKKHEREGNERRRGPAPD